MWTIPVLLFDPHTARGLTPRGCRECCRRCAPHRSTHSNAENGRLYISPAKSWLCTSMLNAMYIYFFIVYIVQFLLLLFL